MKWNLLLFSWLVFSCFFFSLEKIQAQGYDLSYQHITTENGLSNNFVTTIIQDTKGFIWIGTQEGLNKYDGYSFKIYKANTKLDSEQKYYLNSNHITFLMEDSEKDAIWIGTVAGLSKLHTNQDTIETIAFFDKKHINYISIDEQKIVWVATDQGIYKKQNQDWINASFNLNSNQNYSFVGRKQFGKVKKQVLVKIIKELYDINTLFVWEDKKQEWKKILETPYNLQYIDQNEKIWTSYKDEQVDAGYNKVYDKNFKVDSIYFDKSRSFRMTVPFLAFKDKTGDNTTNTAWFFESRGVALVDLNTKKFLHWYYWKYFAETMDQYTVETIFRDSSQNYWICTQGTGIFIFANYTLNNFRTYKYRKGFQNNLSHPSTRAIYQEPKTQTTWVGTYGKDNDVDVFIGDSIKKTLFIDGYVHLIKPDPNHENILWFATTSGIRKIDKEKIKLLETYRMDKTILEDILPINDSTIWIAGQNNLHHFNPTTKKIISYPNVKDISHLFKDATNTLWVGSKVKGIGFLGTIQTLNSETIKKQELIYYNPYKENEVCYIKHIQESRTEPFIFWVSTTNGFYKFDSKKRVFLEHYTEENGLPNNVVYAILEDNEANLWGSTNHGIFKFNPKSKQFTNFDKQDGLQDNEFNTFSYFKSKEGELFFGGIGGINAFFPQNMKKNNFIPPIQLTGFQKLGKEVYFEKPISEVKEISLLKEDAGLLTFRFAALSFYQSTKNKYAYKLEPLQKEWIDLGTKNELTLTNLSAGNYTLYIKGSNNHGVWSKETIKLELKIIPPFWQTNWFYTLCAMVLLTGLYLFYRYKMRASKLRSIELESQVEERTHEILVQTEELQMTNEKLKELDLFKEKTTNMLVHDLKNPLGTIIYEAKNNIPIRKASQRMMNLLMALLDSQKIQSPQFQLNLERTNFDAILNNVIEEVEVFLIEREIEIIYEEEFIFWLEVDKDLIQRVLVNLLTNAIKYSSKRSFIKISIQENQCNFAQITVTDNGVGIDKHQLDTIFDSYRQVNAQKVGSVSSTGLGLSFCKLAVEAHGENCKIYVDSVPNKETHFHFVVPLLEVEKIEHNLANNLVTNQENKTFSHSNSYQFSKVKLNYLQPFIKELNNLEVYQATQIRSILNSLNDESTTVTEWKTEIQEILYRVDEDEYQKLLNINIDPKSF